MNTTETTNTTPSTYNIVFWGDPRKCPTARKTCAGILEVIEFIARLGDTYDSPHSASVYKSHDPTWKGGNLYCSFFQGWVSVSPSREMTPWIWEYPEKSPAILPEDAVILMEAVYASQRIRELEEEVKYLKDEVAARDAWEDMRGKPLPAPAPCLFIPEEADFEERFPV